VVKTGFPDHPPDLRSSAKSAANGFFDSRQFAANPYVALAIARDQRLSAVRFCFSILAIFGNFEAISSNRRKIFELLTLRYAR